jgi:predicted site-specific integrase-resolvase
MMKTRAKITEVGSAINGKRPKLLKLLRDQSIKIIVVGHQDGLEHPNASKEKIRKMTVQGQTLERDEAPVTKSSRQSKSKTAAGKKTKSAAMK